MSKKYLVFLIPLIALAAIGILNGNVYSLGHYKSLGGPGGSVAECDICHDFANGYYESPPSGYNLRWVRTTLNSRTVAFTSFDTPPGTLADGNNALLDGACEVCHHPVELFTDQNSNLKWDSGEPLTDYDFDGQCDPGEPYVDVDGNMQCDPGTKYHNYLGDTVDHYDATNCTVCHPHFLDDINNYFEPRFVGNQAHFTHFNDPKGPMLGINSCTYNLGGCHYPGNFTLFGSEHAPLSTTTICNPCHSKGGYYDGVDDLTTGAKHNWINAIYKAPVVPGEWPSELQEGKENWCLGCHDDAPATIKSVPAPSVSGNSVTYGYNVTGHGIYGDPAITCLGPLPFGCHDAQIRHTDGNAQTYAASQSNYKSGYRLAEGMSIPRYGQYGPLAFKLCFSCHESTAYLNETSMATDFRDDILQWNFHWEHLQQEASTRGGWDSDWNWPIGVVCNEPPFQCSDSSISCTACHNVHGSPCIVGTAIVPCTDPVKNPMIRHGELISTPSASKVPAFQFHWYDQTGNPVTDWSSSRKGGLRCEDPYGISQGAFANFVCWGCHGAGERQYYRLPGGPSGVTVLSVQATDYNNNVPPLDRFSKADDIRYHVNFKFNGPAASYCIKAVGIVKDSTNTQRQTFNYSEVLSPGSAIHEWTWDKNVPDAAATGIAKVIITVKMYNAALCPNPAGTPLYSGKQSDTFEIVP